MLRILVFQRQVRLLPLKLQEVIWKSFLACEEAIKVGRKGAAQLQILFLLFYVYCAFIVKETPVLTSCAEETLLMA